VSDVEGLFPGYCRLLQLHVLRFRFFQDGNLRVGVFPEREEILVKRRAPGCVEFTLPQKIWVYPQTAPELTQRLAQGAPSLARERVPVRDGLRRSDSCPYSER
jgi:hypothetical protein